jgi:hypothetical protein
MRIWSNFTIGYNMFALREGVSNMKTVLVTCFVVCIAHPAAACDVGDRAKALMAQIRNASIDTRKATGGVTGEVYAHDAGNQPQARGRPWQGSSRGGLIASRVGATRTRIRGRGC